MNALGWFLLIALVLGPVAIGKFMAAGNSRRDFVPTAGPDIASAAAGETTSSSPALGEVNNP